MLRGLPLFGFGREDGIRESTLDEGYRIFQPAISTDEDLKYRGILSNSDAQSTSLAQFDVSNIFPDSQQWLMVNGSSVNPVVRRSYLDYSLYVADKVPLVYGMRTFSDNDNNIVYGTHYQRFLFNSAEKDVNYTIQYTDSTLGPNKDSFLLKYLSDLSPYKSTVTDSMPMRNKLFGYVWQYSNDGDHLKNAYSLDSNYTIVQENGTNMPVVRDPFMFKDSGEWHMFYSAYADLYPENDLDTKDKAYDPNETDTSVINEDGRIEDFAGLLEVDAWEENFNKIYYLNTVGTTGEREFNTVPVAEYPNTFDKGTSNYGEISYSMSPSVVNVGDSYRLYYLGWFKGENDDRDPTLGLFCHEINVLGEYSGTPTLVFVFESDTTVYPSNYDGRTSSFTTEDFIWDRYSSANIASYVNVTTDWPTMHPAYSLGFAWATVIKRYDGVYYCFFNKNKSKDSSGTETGNGGTGVLYSTDGLVFREYDKDVTERITDLTDIYWFSPFVYNGKWYASYRDNDDMLFADKNPKVKYALLNWSVIENFEV
jgi:hypothetical protein